MEGKNKLNSVRKSKKLFSHSLKCKFPSVVILFMKEPFCLCRVTDGSSVRMAAGVSFPAWRRHQWAEGAALRALPHTDSQAPAKKHVEQVLYFVCDLEAEALADHNVPRAAELLVHGLLDHLSRALGTREQYGTSLRAKSLKSNFGPILDPLIPKERY